MLKRETWSTWRVFILASIGSAVGIGNIWRFPYIVGLNGGGAFLIPYLISIAIFGIPLMVLELVAGRHFRRSVVPAFAMIKKKFRIAGWVLVAITTAVMSYYLVITSWVLAYTFFLFTGNPPAFMAFTDSYYPLLFFTASGIIAFLVVQAGIRGGIETISKYLVPLLFVLLVALVVYALTLPGAPEGISYYLTPDFSRMSDPFLWTDAFGQTFFSLSVGMGILLTFGSYLRDADLVESAVIVSVADTLIALLSGFLIFPLVFSFGLSPDAGVNLAFVSLPTVFQQIYFGLLIGGLFFLLLFSAAITSVISMLELPVATLIDVTGMERRRATFLSLIIVIIIGLPAAFSYSALRLELFGRPLLDLQDYLFGTLGLILAALLLSIIVGWFLTQTVIAEEIRVGRIGLAAFTGLVRYCIPLVLLFILVSSILELFVVV